MYTVSQGRSDRLTRFCLAAVFEGAALVMVRTSLMSFPQFTGCSKTLFLLASFTGSGFGSSFF